MTGEKQRVSALDEIVEEARRYAQPRDHVAVTAAHAVLALRRWAPHVLRRHFTLADVADVESMIAGSRWAGLIKPYTCSGRRPSTAGRSQPTYPALRLLERCLEDQVGYRTSVARPARAGAQRRHQPALHWTCSKVAPWPPVCRSS